jgi:hypothetical protein
MRAVGVIGQFICFALGLWIGSVCAGTAEMLLHPRAATSRNLPFEFLVVIYVPLCLIVAGLFVGWVAIRSRKAPGAVVVFWPIPLALGLCFFPLVFASIPLLIRATGQGQGNIIGSSIAALFVGILIACAECAYRLRTRSKTNNES